MRTHTIPAPAPQEGALSPSQRNECLSLCKVAVANGVLIASLSLRPPATGSHAKLSFDTHPQYAVVSMVAPPAPPKDPTPKE